MERQQQTPVMTRRSIRSSESEANSPTSSFSGLDKLLGGSLSGNESRLQTYKSCDNVFLSTGNNQSNINSQGSRDSLKIETSPRAMSIVYPASPVFVPVSTIDETQRKVRPRTYSTTCQGLKQDIKSICLSTFRISLVLLIVICFLEIIFIYHHFIELHAVIKQRESALMLTQETKLSLENAKASLARELEKLQAMTKLDNERIKQNIATTTKDIDITKNSLLQIQRKEDEMFEEFYKLKVIASNKIKASLTEEKHAIISNAQKRLQRAEVFLKNQTSLLLQMKYGSGPAKIKMETSEGDIVIETAPFDLLPISIWYFLERVSQGFWDGTCFFRNEFHILQASTFNVDGEDLHPNRDDLDVLPYQEYTYDYPAYQYTLGFVGRPAGPEIYVNMFDNSFPHSPGRQLTTTELPGEDSYPEVTFAKVIDGFDVLIAIQNLDTSEEDGLELLDERVEIKSLKIII